MCWDLDIGDTQLTMLRWTARHDAAAGVSERKAVIYARVSASKQAKGIQQGT